MSNASHAGPSDRRQYPRIEITVPVILKRGSAPAVTALMHNISPGGMQVRVSADASASLEVDAPEDRKSAAPLRASFLLPLRGKRKSVAVDCEVRHVSRVRGAPAGAEMAVGLRFHDFTDTKYLRRFVRFIEEQMVPPEDIQVYLHGPSGGSRGPGRVRGASAAGAARRPARAVGDD